MPGSTPDAPGRAEAPPAHPAAAAAGRPTASHGLSRLLPGRSDRAGGVDPPVDSAEPGGRKTAAMPRPGLVAGGAARARTVAAAPERSEEP